MEQEHLKQLECRDKEQIYGILANFNKKNADLLVFDNFHTNNQWHELWVAVFNVLSDPALKELHTLCLNTVRILTRDEFSLQTNHIENELNTLLRLAQLEGSGLIVTDSISSTPDDELRTSDLVGQEHQQQLATTDGDGVSTKQHKTSSETAKSFENCIIAEALKCLCNLVYQSVDCRRQCLRNHTVDAILKRVASAMRHPCALEFYDMKLLFLLTALEPTARSRLQIDLNGMTYMTKWLDDKLSEPICGEEQKSIIAELLKVMFNVTSNPDKSPNEYEIQSLHLTGVIRDLLLRFSNLTDESERRIVTHAINLLTNISGSCLTELTLKCNNIATGTTTGTQEPASIDVEDNEGERNRLRALCFEKRNVCALEVLLRYLRQTLSQQEVEATSHELVSPVLTVLVKCARADRIMRHYLRSQVLPPLRDVSKRPEVGNELRNHLCRFLTLPAMIIRDLSAELLFVLCKEDVGRMIKYTGYGNAAGLFANRGLLDCRRVEHNEYSSDSEDSDTEEYKQQQDGINPVLGCYEPLKRNPLEGMSEAQKEYEAMQLVGLIDKLNKSGIQPCRIGEDGKPQPLEHILQLQEELPQQQLEQKRKT